MQPYFKATSHTEMFENSVGNFVKLRSLLQFLIGNGAKVLTVENGRLKERQVQVSSPTEKGYLIQSGVEAGEQVVR